MPSTALLLLLATAAIPPAGTGPPIDVARPVAHDVRMTVEVGPARDVLALLASSPDAAAALKRLRSSRPFSLALSRDGGNPEDLLGRLVSVAAGSPDSLLTNYTRGIATYGKVLDALEAEGTQAAMVEARRIAALLPASPAVTARVRIVPLFGLGGFENVVTESDGETTWIFADLPRLAPEGKAEVVPREVVLSLLRASASEVWKTLFARFRVPPAWPDGKADVFDTLLARTVEEGPATLFLFPDEFFPLGTMFEEPVGRSFTAWNEAAEKLLDPKAKEAARREALHGVSEHADFWAHHDAVVGVKLTETLLQRAGTARYVEALAAGPRAVAALYLEVTRKTKEPAFGKAARKALEAPVPRG